MVIFYVTTHFVFCFFYIVKSVRDCTRSQSHQPGLQSAPTALTFEVTTESKMDKAKGILVKYEKIWEEEGIFGFIFDIFEKHHLLLG